MLYWVLHTYTDSDVSLLDAFVSSTAWAGMWLLAKRKLENWVWLNVSNLVAIPLLLYKELLMFSILTLFLFVVAIFGYLDWKKHSMPLTNDFSSFYPVMIVIVFFY
nr:nicotinamide mononucleotide transporter family protein [Haliscomenobacter sp.]